MQVWTHLYHTEELKDCNSAKVACMCKQIVRKTVFKSGGNKAVAASLQNYIPEDLT